ncbi:tRNA pseudouridine(55) synthase TruB [Aurantiacibacter gangjinensis]|uniref:tRNA pseudouridine synthase B n=1 Tax=Aurantiacibacter gangjinensis TaxID=502682 RepID=A0A0G9MS42_9SPHN|nr:tRNA pseudouridine(55) synthase TruB [Aurantiacibacter gangjinensis]APE26915.1 tRNA pseudouridine synthase B [Aurantiacibacter gangjinensis]KLE33374.1 pseudouridine synthase [Aurantiacibacter gangjinensis]
MTDHTPPHGWIILDKPVGLGSTQAVAAVKRNLREGGYPKVKVGHGGTLDPAAEGVLPIALGEATKLSSRMLDSDKVYEFTIQFGEETDTLDAEGDVVARSDRRPPRAAIAAICEHFTGEIDQVPPKYSALKVDGKRAYDLARAGEEVELKTRRVTVRELHPVRPELVEGRNSGADEDRTSESKTAHRATGSARTDFQSVDSAFQTTAGRPDPYDPQAPLELADTATLVAHVSKGTYIRSLARDIAHALGTLGHVIYLRRIKAGPFTQEQAISLDNLNEIGKGAALQDYILPLEAGLDGIPALSLDPESAQAARQGRVVSGLPHPDGLYFAKLGDVPVALVELEGGTMKVVRGFNV